MQTATNRRQIEVVKMQSKWRAANAINYEIFFTIYQVSLTKYPCSQVNKLLDIWKNKKVLSLSHSLSLCVLTDRRSDRHSLIRNTQGKCTKFH